MSCTCNLEILKAQVMHYVDARCLRCKTEKHPHIGALDTSNHGLCHELSYMREHKLRQLAADFVEINDTSSCYPKGRFSDFNDASFTSVPNAAHLSALLCRCLGNGGSSRLLCQLLVRLDSWIWRVQSVHGCFLPGPQWRSTCIIYRH